MRRPNRRPTSTLAIALTACITSAGLAACDRDSEATPPPPTQTTASISPAPTSAKPTPPPLPAAAKGLTVESAEAFTRYYLSLLDYAKRSRDVAPLRAWGDKGCIGCNELLGDYQQVFAAGGGYAGDFTFKNFMSTSVRLNQTKAAEIKFRASIGLHTVTSRRGGKPDTYPGEIVRWTMTLIARDGQWVAFELGDEAG